MPSRDRIVTVSRRMLLDRTTHLGNHISAKIEKEPTKVITRTIRCGPLKNLYGGLDHENCQLIFLNAFKEELFL